MPNNAFVNNTSLCSWSSLSFTIYNLLLSLFMPLSLTTMGYRELNSTPMMLEGYITSTIVLDA
jgi:hypothetical protein